ncbi:MAG: hypothetical protein KDD62_01430 [Bdellovibrionales bacterium]|nr:hypothetical protein [Bdellovibrionales bacterium]
MLVRFTFPILLFASSFLIIFSPANQKAPGALFRLGSEQILDTKVEHLGPTFSSELRLNERSTIRLKLPQKLLAFEDEVAQKIFHAHQSLEAMLGEFAIKDLSVELVSEHEFYEDRKFPRWVNALYVNGQISIPVHIGMNTSELFASVQHEYAHAAIREASAGNCPVWMDEGIAQILEANHHPEISMELEVNFLQGVPLPFNDLRESFTRLETERLPVAYAQSFFAAKHILKHHPRHALQKYFQILKAEGDSAAAYQKAFGEPLQKLENQVWLQREAIREHPVMRF